jgi:hypothetical protein
MKQALGPWGAGLQTDLLPHEMADGALEVARNVSVKSGHVMRMAGRANIGPDYPDGHAPHYLLSYQSTTQRLVIGAGLTRIYTNDFVTTADVSRTVGGAYTGTADDRWAGGVLHGIAVLTNGKDLPQARGDTGSFENLANWPSTTRCDVIRPFRNYLIALNITEGGQKQPFLVKWSHAADPGTLPTSWDTSNPALDAGDFPLSEGADKIVDGLTQGDAFIIYKESSIYRMTYTGGGTVFQFDQISSQHGLLAA